jgi:hypothetical protein
VYNDVFFGLTTRSFQENACNPTVALVLGGCCGLVGSSVQNHNMAIQKESVDIRSVWKKMTVMKVSLVRYYRYTTSSQYCIPYQSNYLIVVG